MTYTLIKGSFHIHYPESPLSGPEPDGDTLKFQPRNPELLRRLPRPNRSASLNRAGITSIRFEAIDALETHFDVEGQQTHQHLDLALAARDALLAQAGFGDIVYFADRPFKVQSVEHHPVEGCILSNGLDTYGRTIAFVYTGSHPAVDGSQIFVTPQMLDDSLNARLLRNGQAYASFYLTLPAELREHLRSAARNARVAGTGLWAEATATTTRPAVIDGFDALQERVIWPKLFRRLAPYFMEGHRDFAALDAWLRADPVNRDDRLLLPTLELGNMHDLIVADGTSIRLASEPEDVVIVPDDYALPAPRPGPPSPGRVGRGEVRVVAALIDAASATERGAETVTLLNVTPEEIDLTGWAVADAAGRMALSGRIGGGEARRIALSGAVRLSNRRDTISLLDAQGALVDQVSYEPRQVPPPAHTRIFHDD